MKPKYPVFIVVAILVLFGLAYLNLPPFHMQRARVTDSSGRVCQNNLRQIDGAINEWALENNKTNGAPVTFENIKPFIKLNSHREIPGCPQGGQYTITVVGAPPMCSLGTNSNPRSLTQKIADYINGKEDSVDWRSEYHRLP